MAVIKLLEEMVDVAFYRMERVGDFYVARKWIGVAVDTSNDDHYLIARPATCTRIANVQLTEEHLLEECDETQLECAESIYRYYDAMNCKRGVDYARRLIDDVGK